MEVFITLTHCDLTKHSWVLIIMSLRIDLQSPAPKFSHAELDGPK